MLRSSIGGLASTSLPLSVTTADGTQNITNNTTNSTQMNNGKTTATIENNDPDWKSKLNVPDVDHRARTSDVTNTSGHDFEDYCLKRELLMGRFDV
jgi:hypothetical protein